LRIKFEFEKKDWKWDEFSVSPFEAKSFFCKLVSLGLFHSSASSLSLSHAKLLSYNFIFFTVHSNNENGSQSVGIIKLLGH